MRILGVLFDVDSTIVKSRPAMDFALEVVAKRIVDSIGRPSDLERVFERMRELDAEMHAKLQYDRDRWWNRILGEFFPDLTFSEDFVRGLTLEYWRIVCEKSELFPDALETVEELKRRGYRLGIVTDTDGTPGVKRWRLERLGIIRLFDTVVVGGEDTAFVKPDPTPFLLAASRIGLRPSECLMVGDRVATDVRGAKAAGMFAALVKRRKDKDCSEADFVLESLEEIKGIL